MSDESHESEYSSFADTQDETDESSDNDNDPLEDLFGDNLLTHIFSSERFREEVARRSKDRLDRRLGGDKGRHGLKHGLSVYDELEINNVATKLSSVFVNEYQLVQHLFIEVCFHLPPNVDQKGLCHEITVAVIQDVFMFSPFETAFLDHPVLSASQPYALVAKPFGQFVASFVDTCADFAAIPSISLTQITPGIIEQTARSLSPIFHVYSTSLTKLVVILEGSLNHLESLAQITSEIEKLKTIDADLHNIELFTKLKTDIKELIDNIHSFINSTSPFITGASSTVYTTEHLSKASFDTAASILVCIVHLEQKLEAVTANCETTLGNDALSLGMGSSGSLIGNAFEDRQDIILNTALKNAQRDICSEAEEIISYNIRLLNAIKFVFLTVEKLVRGTSASSIANEASVYSTAMADLIGSFVSATDVPTIFSNDYDSQFNGGVNKHPLLSKDGDSHKASKRERRAFSYDIAVYRIQQSAASYLANKLHNVVLLDPLNRSLANFDNSNSFQDIKNAGEALASTSGIATIADTGDTAGGAQLQFDLLDNGAFQDIAITELLSANLTVFRQLSASFLKVPALYKLCADFVSHVQLSRPSKDSAKISTTVCAASSINEEITQLKEICQNFQLQLDNQSIVFSEIDTPFTSADEVINFAGILRYRAICERAKLTNFLVSVFMAPFTFGHSRIPILEVSTRLLYEFINRRSADPSFGLITWPRRIEQTEQLQGETEDRKGQLDLLVYDIVLSTAITNSNMYVMPVLIYYFGSTSIEALLDNYFRIRSDELFARFLVLIAHYSGMSFAFHTNLPLDEQARMIDHAGYVPAELDEDPDYDGDATGYRDNLIKSLQVSYAAKMVALPISRIFAIYQSAISGFPDEEFVHLPTILVYMLRTMQGHEALDMSSDDVKADFLEHAKLYVKSYMENNPVIEYMVMLLLFRFGTVSVTLPDTGAGLKEKKDHLDATGFTDDVSSYSCLFEEANYVIDGDDIFSGVCYIHEAPIYLFSKSYAQGANRTAFIYLHEIYEQGKRFLTNDGSTSKVTPRISFGLTKERLPLVFSARKVGDSQVSQLVEAVVALLFPLGNFSKYSEYLQELPSFQRLMEMTCLRMGGDMESGSDVSSALYTVNENMEQWAHSCGSFFDEIVDSVMERAKDSIMKILYRQAIEAVETQAFSSLSSRFNAPEYNPLRLHKPVVSQTVKELRERSNVVAFHSENKTPFDTDPTREKSPSFVGACKNYRIMVCIPCRLVFSGAVQQHGGGAGKPGRPAAGGCNNDYSGPDNTTFVVLDRYGRHLSHITLSRYHKPLPNPLRLGPKYEKMRNDFRSIVSSLSPTSGSLVSCPRDELFKILDPALQLYTSNQTEFQRILDEAMLQDFIISSGVCAIGILSRNFTSETLYHNLEATLQYLNQPLPVYVEKSLTKPEPLNTTSAVDTNAAMSGFDTQPTWKNVEFPCTERALIGSNPLFIDDLFFKRQPLAYNIARINLVRIPADVPMALYAKKQRILHDPSFVNKTSSDEEGTKLSFQKHMNMMVHVLQNTIKTSSNILLSSSPFYLYLAPANQIHDAIYLCRRKAPLTVSNARQYHVTNRSALESLQLNESGSIVQKNELSQNFFKTTYLPGVFAPYKTNYGDIARNYCSDNVILGIWAGRYLLDPLAAYACLANGGGSMEDLVTAPLIGFLTEFSPLPNLDYSDKVRLVNTSSDFYLRFKTHFSFIGYYALSLAVHRRRPDINLPFISPHYAHMISLLPWLSPRKLLRLYSKISVYQRYDRFLVPSSDMSRYAKLLQQSRDIQTYIQRLKALSKSISGSSPLAPYSKVITDLTRQLEDCLNNDLTETVQQTHNTVAASTSCNVHGELFTFESLNKRRNLLETELDIFVSRKVNESRKRGLIFKNKTLVANMIADLLVEEFVLTYCLATPQLQDTMFTSFTTGGDMLFSFKDAIQAVDNAAKGISASMKGICTVADICNIQLLNPELYTYEQCVADASKDTGVQPVYSVHFEGSVLIPNPPERVALVSPSRRLVALTYYNKFSTILQKKSLMDIFLNPSYTPTNVMCRVCQHMEDLNTALASSFSITHDVILSYIGNAYSNAYTANNPHIITILLLRWVIKNVKTLSLTRYRHPVDRAMLTHVPMDMYYTTLFHSVSITAFFNNLENGDGNGREYDGEGGWTTKTGSETTFWPANLADCLTVLKSKELESLSYHDMIGFAGEETRLVLGLFLKLCTIKGSRKLDDFLHSLTLKTSLFQTDYLAAQNLSLLLLCLQFRTSAAALASPESPSGRLFSGILSGDCGKDSDVISGHMEAVQERLRKKLEGNYQWLFSAINHLVISKAGMWPNRVHAAIVSRDSDSMSLLKQKESCLFFAKELCRYLTALQSDDNETIIRYKDDTASYSAIRTLCNSADKELDKVGDEEPLESLVLSMFTSFQKSYLYGCEGYYTGPSHNLEALAPVWHQDLLNYLVERFNRPLGRASVDELQEGKRDFTDGFLFLCSIMLTLDPLLSDALHSPDHIRPILAHVVDSITQAARYHQLRYPTMELIEAGKSFTEYNKETIFLSLTAEHNPAVFSRYKPFKVFCPLSQRGNGSLVKSVYITRYEGLEGQLSFASDPFSEETEDLVETVFDAYLYGIDLRRNILALTMTLSQDGDNSFEQQRRVSDCLPQLHANKLQMRLLNSLLSAEQSYKYSALGAFITSAYLGKIDKVPKTFAAFLDRPISLNEIMMNTLKKLSTSGLLDPGDTVRAQCTNFTRLSLYTLLARSMDTIAGNLYRDLLNSALQQIMDWLVTHNSFFTSVSELNEFLSDHMCYLANNNEKIEKFNPRLYSEVEAILATFDAASAEDASIQFFLNRLTIETYMPLAFLCREAQWNYAAYISALLFLNSQRYAAHIRQQQQQDLCLNLTRREINDPYFKNLQGHKVYHYLIDQRATDERPFAFVPHPDGSSKLRLVMHVPEAYQISRSFTSFTIHEDERYKPLLPNKQRNLLALSGKLTIRQLIMTDELEKIINFSNNECVFDSLDSIIRDFVRPLNSFLRSIAQSNFFVRDDSGSGSVDSAREKAKQMLHQSAGSGYRIFIDRVSTRSYTMLFKCNQSSPIRELRIYIVLDGAIVRSRRKYFYVECRTWSEFIVWFNKNLASLR